MEKYLMPVELDWQHLRYCLDNYTAERLFIRTTGHIENTMHGRTLVNELLDGRVLDFSVDDGLSMILDGKEVFRFPLEDHDRGFDVAYERIKDGVMVMLPTGINPDDPDLPEPQRSTLRTVLDHHYMEIDFTGKIPLKKHSPWLSGLYYWQIVTR